MSGRLLDLLKVPGSYLTHSLTLQLYAVLVKPPLKYLPGMY